MSHSSGQGQALRRSGRERERMKYQLGAFALLGALWGSGCSSEPPEFGMTGADGAGGSEETGPGGPADERSGGGTEPDDSAPGGAPAMSDTDETDPSGEEDDSDGAGETDEPDGPSQSTDAESTDGDALTALGEECDRAQECESGYCVDGVCCEDACAEVCSECNGSGTAGSCTVTPQDATCALVMCPQDTECRHYTLPGDGNCAEPGLCASAASCVSSDAASGTACQDGTGECNGTGQCLVPNKASLGEPCTTDEECGSEHCALADAGGICCDQACDGVCEACGNDGFCDEAPEDDDGCSAITCDADDACVTYPPPLTDDRCAAFGQCVTESSYCTPTYASGATSCGDGQLCDGAGVCESACSPDEAWCTDACYDLDSDDDHCGACDNACPSGRSCVDGECECEGASEALCLGNCFDLNKDVNHCGKCGNACPQPAEPDSTRICEAGMCGACGAYTQLCCSGASACAEGLSCSEGACLCPMNTHRCTTGPAAGTCAANDNATACGSACLDCTQANADAACTSGACNNSCREGVAELCAGADGRPGCGSWDFELDEKQDWQIDITVGNNAASPAEWGNIGADGTMHSLAIPIAGSSGGAVRVRVPLCAANVNLSGTTVSGFIRFESDAGQTPPSGNGYVTLYSGSEVAGSLAQLTNYGPTWVAFADQLDSSFIINPDARVSVSHVGLTLLISSAWSGTIYIDEFQISD